MSLSRNRHPSLPFGDTSKSGYGCGDGSTNSTRDGSIFAGKGQFYGIYGKIFIFYLHKRKKSCTFVADFDNHDLKNTRYAS